MFLDVVLKPKEGNKIIIEISVTEYKRAVTDSAWTEGTLSNESKREFQLLLSTIVVKYNSL